MSTSPLIPVILAGGSGTRLWPLSRKNYPKQFLCLNGETSLLQQTVQRTLELEYEHILVVSNEAHYFLCQEQLQNLTPKITYILEPYAKNTAAAIASASHYLTQTLGLPDAMMLILPSDHWIADTPTWKTAMLQGAQHAASSQSIVTFGIKPDSPKTGYGYIKGAEVPHQNAFAVSSFHEKPSQQTAEHFLAEGCYYWNSGMFICRAETYLNQLQEHASDIFYATKQAVEKGILQHNYYRLSAEDYAQCRQESIDYAVMEKTNIAVVIPVNMQWNDLGCWTAVAEANPLDTNGNALHGNVIAQDSNDCLISSQGTLVTALGLHDQIIVATADAVLVADKRYSQQVKDIVNSMEKNHAKLLNDHLRVIRPWGYYEILAEGATFKVKRLMVKPGAALSLQMHHFRAEHWVVVGGRATVINDEKTIYLNVNQSTYIPQKTRHRLSNEQEEPLYVIEVQTGDYLGEDDIIRFADVYERMPNATNQVT